MNCLLTTFAAIGALTPALFDECAPPGRAALDVQGGQACGADFNGDGVLNVLDFVRFQIAWGEQDAAADCDDNGAFDVLDFVCFQLEFDAGGD